jgi:NADPH:quinone reductase-like Zn-dependent oxidoreductase
LVHPEEEVMKDMKAIVITRYGEPEVLEERRLPIPVVTNDTVVVRVRAFGLNHAEAYFRRGVWGDVAKVTGIECVGEVHDPGATKLQPGQRVFALMGGMGRTIDGSYAEYVRAPASNVVPFESQSAFTMLAAVPESYATAWVLLRHNLEAKSGQVIVVRGGTSALGQAIVNVARDLEIRVLATTRSRERAAILEAIGAEPLIDGATLTTDVRKRIPAGVDGVIDLVGTSTLIDSFNMVRYRGHVAMAGFLGGGDPLTVDPLMQMPGGMHFSFFASAFTFGGPDLPLSQIPFADFVARSDRGVYRSAPAHVFGFHEIVEAHRLMESGKARGKIVVRTDA